MPPTYTPEQLVDIGDDMLDILFDGLGVKDGTEPTPCQIRLAVAIIMALMMAVSASSIEDYPDDMRDAMLAFAGVPSDAP